MTAVSIVVNADAEKFTDEHKSILCKEFEKDIFGKSESKGILKKVLEEFDFLTIHTGMKFNEIKLIIIEDWEIIAENHNIKEILDEVKTFLGIINQKLGINLKITNHKEIKDVEKNDTNPSHITIKPKTVGNGNTVNIIQNQFNSLDHGNKQKLKVPLIITLCGAVASGLIMYAVGFLPQP